MKEFKINAVLDKLGIKDYDIIGQPDMGFSRPSAIQDGGHGSIIFCVDENVTLLASSRASVILLTRTAYESLGVLFIGFTYVIVDDPKQVFIRILEYCFPSSSKPVIKKGEGVIIHPNCVIGSEGFGFEKDKDGIYHNFPHYGGVVIGDDVEIFPFTNVDRGTLGNTVIGRGTKIDHHCHIGHNVRLGDNCIVTAGTIIGGSTVVGDDVWIGIGSLIRDNIKIGYNAVIGMGSVVINDVAAGAVVYGNPAREHNK